MRNAVRRLYGFAGVMAMLSCSALIAPVHAEDAKPVQPLLPIGDALQYLEISAGKTSSYIKPSEIDGRYNVALYVNAKGRGPNAQRMWVLQRDKADGRFKLAMWDKAWWSSKSTKRRYGDLQGRKPPFSWLVSTGRKWRGDSRSGPTKLGVFALDERRGRTQRGYHTRGMIHVMYIDLHYSSGRRSGIAFHGTTRSQYRRLGSIASHGCIRMHQSNALKVLSRIKGWDKALSKDDRWGEVPRFWRRERYSNRYGYVHDGTLLTKKRQRRVRVAELKLSAPSGTDGDVMTDALASARVLTKTGFRAIAVIFKD